MCVVQAAVGPRGANNTSNTSTVPTQKRTKTIKVDQARSPPPGAQQEQPGSFTAALNDAMAGPPVCIELHHAFTCQAGEPLALRLERAESSCMQIVPVMGPSCHLGR